MAHAQLWPRRTPWPSAALVWLCLVAAGSSGAQPQGDGARADGLHAGGGLTACVAGRVFVECKHKQPRDNEEVGIPGVRLYLLDGTRLITDAQGLYSLCGLPPRTNVLKLDRMTLPTGARLVSSSLRNAADAHSAFVDPRAGGLLRQDFIEGTCSEAVLEQVKARRNQGAGKAGSSTNPVDPALRFEGRAPQTPPLGLGSTNPTALRP